jgi:hypothetical protein
MRALKLIAFLFFRFNWTEKTENKKPLTPKNPPEHGPEGAAEEGECAHP